MCSLAGMNFDAQTFWRLYGTIREFKASLRERFPWAAAQAQPLVAHPGDNLNFSIAQLVQQRRHCLTVINAAGHPIATLTQKDLLLHLINN